MDTTQQPTAVNGSRDAIGASDKLTCDGRVRVFQASPVDFDALMHMLESVHYESPRLSSLPFSEERAFETIDYMMSRQDSDTLILISYMNGEAIGCMGAMLCPQLTSKTLIASEMLLYVNPVHRGTRAALMMVKTFEKWSEPYDMRAGSSLGINDKRAISFYSSLGYETDSVGVMKRGIRNG